MKGVKKCYGLLLLLSIMLGLSLSVSLDVNATKHQITHMPLYNYNYIFDGNVYWNLNPVSEFSITLSDSSDFDLSKTHSFRYFPADRSGSSCVFSGSSRPSQDGHWSLNGNILSSGSRPAFSSSDPSTTLSYCSRNVPFGSDGSLPFDSSSFGTTTGIVNQWKSDYLSLLPYNYSYSSFTFSDTYTDNGFVYISHGLKFSDLFGSENLSYFSRPSSLSFPIGVIHDIQSSDFTSISSGTNLTFNYELYFTGDEDISSYDLSVFDDSVVSLLSRGIDDFSVSSTVCSSTSDHDGFGIRFTFSCSWTATHDYPDNLVGFGISIVPGSNRSSIWDVTFRTPTDSSPVSGDITFFIDSISVVSDFDSTPGLPVGSNSSGNFASPGSARFEQEGNASDYEPSWFDSLFNMFNFGFFNPFQPLFNLFADDQSCANIPTIANMIHSQDTTVCHFFDSGTRNLLTPVFGLASSMLVFGFAVRWLGASSGNFFDDSGTHDTRHFRFCSRGVIKS